MANPRPSKSKPCKIGRKHSGELREREKQAKRNGMKIWEAQKKKRAEKIKQAVRAYWCGELAEYP